MTSKQWQMLPNGKIPHCLWPYELSRAVEKPENYFTFTFRICSFRNKYWPMGYVLNIDSMISAVKYRPIGNYLNKNSMMISALKEIRNKYWPMGYVLNIDSMISVVRLYFNPLHPSVSGLMSACKIVNE